MPYQFAKRPYGPESTPEEVQAIRDCISRHEPGILYWRELPVQSVFHLDIFDQRLTEESREMDQYDLIIDLTDAGGPNAEIRERVKKLFDNQPKVRRVAVFTGKNFALNIAAKFALGATVGLKNFSVSKSLDDALADIRRAAAKAAQ